MSQVLSAVDHSSLRWINSPWPPSNCRGWEVKRTKYIFNIVNGGTPKSSDSFNWGEEFAWVTPEDLGNLLGNRLTETGRSLSRIGYGNCGATQVPAGSLIISTRAPIGNIAIAGRAVCTNQGCRALTLRAEGDSRYYFYQFIAARPVLEALGQGSTFRELSTTSLANINVLCPPTPTQKEIADFLDNETNRIDTLISKFGGFNPLLSELRSAVISAAVTGSLFLKGTS